MARKSRKQSKNVATNAMISITPKSLTGIYVRLSVEDNGYGTKDSILNQIAFLKEYVEKHKDELQLTKVYVDNGTTGTNFDREKWNSLIEDIKVGEINCVVIKDFSRMGRNYIEVGNYLEKIFPFLGVRVIAVNENFDSDKQSFESSMLMNSLTNIVNEYYARDISKKITQTKRTMQKKGEYVSSVLPYGYRKSDEDKKKLVIDAESSSVVKKIFEWRIQGKGCLMIANYLNDLAVPSPGMYRYMNGNQAFKRSSNTKWKSKHVAGILTNPVYLGHMVQGKTRCSYFEQEGKLRFLPKKDWLIVENMHEALVTQEQFDIAADMAEKSRKRHIEQIKVHADIPHVDNLLRKKIFCGQCGGLMTRRSRVQRGIRDYCYFCSAPQMNLGVHCTNTHIHEVPLMDAVIKATDEQLRLFGKLESGWVRQKQSEDYFIKKRKRDGQRRNLEETISSFKRQRQELYADMKEGLLTLPDYEYEKKRLTETQIRYEKELNNIVDENEIEDEIENVLGQYRKNVLKMADGVMPIDSISMDMLDILIEKIMVFSPERIEITYAFTNELE